MSDSHQLYAVTGHRLPLRLKRTPPRHGAITSSKEQECRTSVRANLPGRSKTPRDAESTPTHAALQRESKLSYRGEDAYPSPEGSKNLVLHTPQKSKTPLNQLTAPSTLPQHFEKSTEIELDDLSSCFSSHYNSAPDTNAKMHPESDFSVEVGYATPPNLNMTAFMSENCSSTDSRPSLNRIKFEAAVAAAEDQDRNAALTQLNEMSRARRSQAPVNTHSTPAAAVPASRARSTATQSTLSRYNHCKGSVAYSNDQRQQAESIHGAHQKYQQQPRSQGASSTEAATHPAASGADSSRQGGATSHDPSASKASSYRLQKYSSRSSSMCYVEQHSCSPSRTSRGAHLPSPLPADPHVTHEYSQQKMAERRASKSRVVSSSQPMAVVPVSSSAWSSIRTSRSGENQLEMGIPIAERVHFVPASARHRDTSASVPVGTLEGTELLPGLPRLQGHYNDGKADRPYRTIIRFIEYQPKGERPGLEKMLASHTGHENSLCCALGEVYGDDLEILRSVCRRTPVVPLLAERPSIGKRTTASSQS